MHVLTAEERASMPARALSRNASGLILDPYANEYLLHFRDNRTPYYPEAWALFGGGCEGNETPREGLLRELEEELCLQVHPKVLLDKGKRQKRGGEYSHYFLVLMKREWHNLTLLEGAGMAWFSPEALIDLTRCTRVTPGLLFLRDRNHIPVPEERLALYQALVRKYS